MIKGLEEVLSGMRPGGMNAPGFHKSNHALELLHFPVSAVAYNAFTTALYMFVGRFAEVSLVSDYIVHQA